MDLTIQEQIVNLSDYQLALFKYREKGTGKLYNYVRLDKNGQPLFVSGKRIAQLCRFMGLSKRELERQIVEERNKVLNERKHGVQLNVSIDTEHNSVIRVAGLNFVFIPHSVVINSIIEVLRTEGIPYTKNISGDGRYGRFTLDMGYGDLIKYDIWFFNKNDAQHALRIGSGFTVLACQNGLISHKDKEIVRLIHRKDEPEPFIAHAVRSQLSTLSGLAVIIENLKSKPLLDDIGFKLIEQSNYPLYMKSLIKDAFQTNKDGTMWGLSMSYSNVATHQNLYLEDKIKLSEDATKLQEITVRSE